MVVTSLNDPLGSSIMAKWSGPYFTAGTLEIVLVFDVHYK